MNTNCVVRREFIEDYSEETIKENTLSDIDAILQSLLSTESRSLRLISVTVRISLLFIVLFFLTVSIGWPVDCMYGSVCHKPASTVCWGITYHRTFTLPSRF